MVRRSDVFIVFRNLLRLAMKKKEAAENKKAKITIWGLYKVPRAKRIPARFICHILGWDEAKSRNVHMSMALIKASVFGRLACKIMSEEITVQMAAAQRPPATPDPAREPAR